MADDKSDIANGQWVSGNFFSGLGIGAALGRTITEEDDKPSSTPTAMISYSYWQKRFALSPDVQGKTIRVNDAPFTIVGVTESKFGGTLQVDEAPDVFIPLSFEPVVMGEGIGLGSRLANANIWWVYIMGRSKPRVTSDQIRANLQSVFDETNSEAASTYKGPPGSLERHPTCCGSSYFQAIED